MKMLKKILKGIICGLLCLGVILGVRTVITKSKQVTVQNKDLNIKLNMDKASKNLSKALQYKTISYTDPTKFHYNEFIKLHQFIDNTYPNVKSKLKKEVINNYSLLYTWQGKNKDLKPLVLTAHMDVVDVEEATLKDWKHDPFSGDIAEGKVWGRGARDNKCQVFSILEAVEYLIQNGYEPERTIYLAFGHDEEVRGVNGAAKIAEVLESRGVKAECLVDEGGAIVKNQIPGVSGQVALVGFGEKGDMNLKLSAKLDGGHSSDPKKTTAISTISNAITKLNNYKFKGSLEYVKPTFEYAAPEANVPLKIVMSNTWLTGGILEKALSSSSDTDSLLRTTKVATIFNTGFLDNVIPYEASTIVNFRLLPGDTVEGVKEKVMQIIDDKNVKVELYGYCKNAPEVSPTNTEAFIKVQQSLKEVFPDAISVPYFTSGGTDSKYYTKITKNRYQMTPSVKEKDEKGHGINERIPIDNYEQYIKVFIQLIKNFN